MHQNDTGEQRASRPRFRRPTRLEWIGLAAAVCGGLIGPLYPVIGLLPAIALYVVALVIIGPYLRRVGKIHHPDGTVSTIVFGPHIPRLPRVWSVLATVAAVGVAALWVVELISYADAPYAGAYEHNYGVVGTLAVAVLQVAAVVSAVCGWLSWRTARRS